MVVGLCLVVVGGGEFVWVVVGGGGSLWMVAWFIITRSQDI